MNPSEQADADSRRDAGTQDAPEPGPEVPTCFNRRPCDIKCSIVTVQPVMFLSNFCSTMSAPLITQYLRERVSEDVGYNASGTSVCANASVASDPLHQAVETLTARWDLYIQLGGFFVGLLMVPLLGSWSDVAGRRPVLLLSSMGLVLQAGVYLLVLYLKLPVVFGVFGKIVSGLFGDTTVVQAASFSYMADISDTKSRTFKIAILELCLGTSGALAGFIGGKWLHAQGYVKPYCMILALNLALTLYVYLFIPETVQPDPSAKVLSFRHYKSIWRLLTAGGSGIGEGGGSRRRELWLYMLCMFVVVAVHSGASSLLVPYELSSPLCWGPALVGYGSAALNLANLSSVLGLKLMQLCLAESSASLIGLLSHLTGLVVFAFASTTALMLTGYALRFLYMVPSPVLRSVMSKMVDPSQLGALFAALGCMESLCLLMSTSMFSILYSATLHFMKGFSFLFASILLLIPAGIIMAERGLQAFVSALPHKKIPRCL